MHAVIRTYSGTGASQVFDLVSARQADVNALLSGVPGFVSYAALREGDGGVTVTVCHDRAGTDESSRRAAAFVRENLDTEVDPPVITEGDTVLQFSS
jgi:hypothetical protein